MAKIYRAMTTTKKTATQANTSCEIVCHGNDDQKQFLKKMKLNDFSQLLPKPFLLTEFTVNNII